MTSAKDQIQEESGEYSAFGIDTNVIIAGQEYFKHQVHWYDDGNLGFLVEDTAFFIHRGVISRKSTVMKTLINSSPSIQLGDPVTPYEQLHSSSTKGLPFIKLESQDRATDFAHVLDIVYPEVLCSTPAPELTAAEIMGLVQFANKYLIRDIKAWAVSALEIEHLVVVEDEWVNSALEKRYSPNPGFCVDIIQLSRECQLPQFLPLAFYALATMEWSVQPQGAALSLGLLSSADRWRVLQGRGVLAEAVQKRRSDVYVKLRTAKQCPKNRKACCDVWSGVASNLHHWWGDLLLHPLEELELLLINAEDQCMCEVCYTELQMEMREFRDELIGSLTEFFRLE